VIFSDQQVPYYAALAAADRGNYQPCVTFIEEHSVDTMGLVRGRLRAATDSIESELAAMDPAVNFPMMVIVFGMRNLPRSRRNEAPG
jgi:hypothetical protein